MKKILLISSALVTVVSLTACSDTSSINSELTSQTEKQSKEITKTEKSAEIPDWGANIGIVEPKGLTVIPNTFKERDDEIKKSFEIKFTGDVDKLFSEARRVTSEMGLKIDWEDETEFLSSKKMDNGYLVTISVKTDTSKKFVDQPFLWYNVEKKK